MGLLIFILMLWLGYYVLRIPEKIRHSCKSCGKEAPHSNYVKENFDNDMRHSPRMKVKDMLVFDSRFMESYKPFYATKRKWNRNLFSYQPQLYCRDCFREKFKEDDRILIEVLEKDIWFE